MQRQQFQFPLTQGLWAEIIHHAVDVHEWQLAIPGGYNQCGHLRQTVAATVSETPASEMEQPSSSGTQPSEMSTEGEIQATVSSVDPFVLGNEGVRQWLKADSPAHSKLRSVVLDSRVLKKVDQYITCRWVQM